MTTSEQIAHAAILFNFSLQVDQYKFVGMVSTNNV